MAKKIQNPDSITRAEIHEKIRELTENIKNREEITALMEDWFEKKDCSPVVIERLLNDLISYQEYYELIN